MDSVGDRLRVERDQTVERLANLTDDFDAVVAASRDTNADDEHDPEGATIAFERSQIGALVRQARQHLVEIDAATNRLDSGTYGVCEAVWRGDRRRQARGQAGGPHVHPVRDEMSEPVSGSVPRANTATMGRSSPRRT